MYKKYIHIYRLQEFKNAQVYPVMIVSYEMFVRYCETIKQSQFDLLVCDEGHRLKNSNIKTASVSSLERFKGVNNVL